MENIIKELTNPVWWITVVIAGIIINILSSYIKSALEKSLLSTFSWWSSISEKRRLAEIEKVKLLSTSKKERYKAYFLSSRNPSISIYLLLMGVFMMLLSESFVIYKNTYETIFYVQFGLLIFGAFCFFMSYLIMIDSFLIRKRLFNALDSLSENETP